jgi:hypothetical protein
LREPEECSEGALNPPIAKVYNLDEDAKDWDIYCEGLPAWSKNHVSTPALDGKALRCALSGAYSYSNVHCYRNLLPEPTAAAFTLTIPFFFTPTTTCNNQGSPSVVQALEFTVSKWHRSYRYEFALQWQNVGDGAPQWRYWDPRGQPDQWVSLSPPITQCLEGGKWHTLLLEGEIVSGEVHYREFDIDGNGHTLNLITAPVLTPGEPDRLAVAFQLDGNYAQLPYEVIVDQVSLVWKPAAHVYLPTVMK